MSESFIDIFKYDGGEIKWIFDKIQVLAGAESVVKAMISSENGVVSGATVTLTGDSTFTGTTDEDGFCEIENVVAGEYIISVVADGYETYAPEVSKIITENTLLKVNLIEDASPYNIRLSVKDGSDSGISGVEVTLTETETGEVYTKTSTATGAGVIKDVLAGSYNVTATKEGYEDYASSSPFVVDGAKTLEIVMTEASQTG